MTSTLNQPPASGATRSSNLLKTWLPILLFGVLWADLVRQLSYTWETNEQYAYGWFVPFFALALIWRRWMTRPAARPQASPFWLVALVVAAAAILLPVRVVYEINPDWPLCSWPMTLTVVGISLYAVFLMGGWKWVKHFAFPVCFILVAVRWPSRIEDGLTQGLMQVVAGVTVELLGWLNIPAFQHGNLIELSTGVVGIDEACSGIRSFQSTLMAGLLMGELYRLRVWARAGLVGCGLLLAFCFNVVRTLLLSWQAGQHGLAIIDKWHDPTGMTIAVACFFALWLLAVLIKRKWSTSVPSLSPREMTSSPIPPGPLSPREMAKQPISPGPLPSLQPSFPRRYLLAVGCWSLLCIGATEAWYRSHEATDTGFVRWSVQLPETKPAYQTIKLPPRTVKLLAYDSGTAARWQEADGSEWEAYFFQWQGKSIQSIMAARYHRPEVCLPASGLKQISDTQTGYFEVVGLKLAFQKSSYSASGQMLYVFYCIWQDGDERRSGLRSRTRGDRLLGAIEGRRRFGQQVLEIITSGYANAAEAEQAVRQRLPDLIRVERPTGPAKSPGSH